MRLSGKVAVITGGSSGIGLAIAKCFKAEGPSLAICGRNREALDEAQVQLGENVLAVQADISNLSDLDRLFQVTSERFGEIDVLVASAGDGKFVPMDHVDEEIFDYIANINFRGCFSPYKKHCPT